MATRVTVGEQEHIAGREKSGTNLASGSPRDTEEDTRRSS